MKQLWMFFFMCLVFNLKGATKPNVIIIYADDLGRGILGSYGQQVLKTPNIDRLASDGMQFYNSYGL